MTVMTVIAVVTRWGLPALGLILVGAGLVMASQPVSFGWFAYAPLSDAVFMRFPPSLVPTGAAVALIAGTALVAGWVGFRLGRRPHGKREN